MEVRAQHLRGLVHFFVDLLHRQLDVKLDAVEDILEIRLLVYFKLHNEDMTGKLVSKLDSSALLVTGST